MDASSDDHTWNLVTVVGGVVAAALLLWNAWPAFETVVDDAYITARYARSYAEGAGIVYSAGEPAVEGITDVAWCLLIGWGLWLGFDVVSLLTWWGYVFGVVTVGCAIGLTGQLAKRPGTVWSVVPALMIAISPHFGVASTNGLESTMFSAWVLGSVWAAFSLRGGWRWAAGVLVGASVLVRPEGFVIGALVVGFDLLRRRRLWRVLDTWALAIPTGVLWSLVTAWRRWTYGMWMPNTFYAKADFPITETFEKNAAYLTPESSYFAVLAVLMVVGLMLKPWSVHRGLVALIAVALAVIPLSVILWMPGLRLFLPSIALVLCLIGSTLPRLPRWGAVPLALVLLMGAGWHHTDEVKRVRAYDGRHSILPGNGTELVAKHLAAHLPPGSWLVVRDAGVLAYYIGHHVKIAEIHPRALTQKHPDGKDAAYREYSPKNPEVLATTLRRDHQTEFTYGPGRVIFNRLTDPYRYVGRVYQHYHRYYDVYVRSDLAVPPLPDELVVNFNGVVKDGVTPDGDKWTKPPKKQRKSKSKMKRAVPPTEDDPPRSPR